MNTRGRDATWAAGDAYERYMGRWSRRIAETFLAWLGANPAGDWLEIGCGTGALTSAILQQGAPASVLACDPSRAFIEHAGDRLSDARVSLVIAGAEDLPQRPGGFDYVVSALVLNFLPEPRTAVAAMRDRARPGGVVAGYVWDYAGGMQFLRCFWDAAVALDPDARSLVEARRFAASTRGGLESLFREAGLRQVRSGTLEIPTRFASFSDYWQPFLGGTGPAPAYVASLPNETRAALRDRLSRELVPGPDGAIELIARAWAVRGVSPAP